MLTQTAPAEPYNFGSAVSLKIFVSKLVPDDGFKIGKSKLY